MIKGRTFRENNSLKFGQKEKIKTQTNIASNLMYKHANESLKKFSLEVCKNKVLLSWIGCRER